MRKRFIGILCVASGLMLSLAGCGGSEEVTPNPGPVIPDTVPGMTISGDAYDYRKTGQPERPYMLTYYDKMLMKAFMSEKKSGGGTTVKMNYEDVLNNIKVIDNLTRGIKKIIYLVGWQFDGHDSKYPAFNKFNEALKRDGDATAKDSYFWLKKEAEKYNTIISVHLNVNSVYEDSPLWITYLRNDLLVREADGSLRKDHQVCLTNEWNKGFLQKRVDEVTQLLDLPSSKTVHLDVFIPVESPFHQISVDDEQSTMRKLLRYWRDKGVDVTVETWHNGNQRPDPMYGLIPAAWWNDMTVAELCKISPKLACGGQIFPGWDYYQSETMPPSAQLKAFLFGSNMHGEDIISKNTDYDKFKRKFCTTTLPWTFLNRHKVLSYDEEAGVVQYSDSLVVDGKRQTMKLHGHLLRDHNNLFIPATWITDHREVIAYSGDGYDSLSWDLPDEWKDVTEVKAAVVGKHGLSEPTVLKVADGKVTLSLSPGEMVSLQPSETNK